VRIIGFRLALDNRRVSPSAGSAEAIAARLRLGKIADEMTSALDDLESRIQLEMKRSS